MSELQKIEAIQNAIAAYWSGDHKAKMSEIGPVMSSLCKDLQKLEDMAQ